MNRLWMYVEHTTEEDGKTVTWVRKERFDELQRAFDAVCESHTEFVNKIHEAILRPNSLEISHDEETRR